VGTGAQNQTGEHDAQPGEQERLALQVSGPALHGECRNGEGQGESGDVQVEAQGALRAITERDAVPSVK